ncbi:transmembrane E3 ubiquitin-protein ligase 1 [[Candida] anglica]|uniref:RING-type E3 ubiquitin transferase n=1 Tax=[Candida] anglica TaxID=148631 RepID=A0ABP0EI64_9ASCO
MQIDKQTFIFFVIMFIFLSVPGGGDQPHSDRDKVTLEKFKQCTESAFAELSNTTYTGGYGNVTGFLLSYNDSLEHKNASNWPIHEYNSEHPWVEDEKFSVLPNVVSEKVQSFWSKDRVGEGDDELAYMLNITGRTYGKFVSNGTELGVKPVKLSIPSYLKDYAAEYTDYKRREEQERYDNDPDTNDPPSDYPLGDWESNSRDGNITATDGKIYIGLENMDYTFKEAEFKNIKEEDHINNAMFVNVEVLLSDFPSIEQHRVTMIGVYLQDSGSLLTATTSAKFRSNFALPHLSMTSENYDLSQKLLSQLMNLDGSDNNFSTDILNRHIIKANDQCEYILYAQFEKTEFTKKELREIDDELRIPTGRPLKSKIPKLKIKQFLLYSPDCGRVIQSAPGVIVEGDKREVFNLRIKTMLTLFAGLLMLQLILFIRQIQIVKTPGQLSTLSSTTVSIFGYQDSLVALCTLLTTNLYYGLYLLPVCMCVFSFIMAGIFEMRFLVNILVNQANERGISWWEILRSSSSRQQNEQAQTANENTGNETTEGAAAAAGTGVINNTTGTAVTMDQTDESRIANGLFAKTFFLTLTSFFFLITALQWRNSFRHISEFIGLILMNTYWLPQFFRNTLKNRRRSFSWEFIICSSFLRVCPVYYLTLYENNPMRHHKNVPLALTVTIWLVFQMVLLKLQEKFGARFWINDKWLPKAYDYHPILNVSDLENGFSSDILANIRELHEADDSTGIVTCKVDCTICMNEIDLPVIVNSEVKITGPGSTDRAHAQEYMITPCHHIFHTECLEDWMKYKLQCPVCRSSLPPV